MSGELGVVEALGNMLDHDDPSTALGALHEISRCEIHMIEVQVMEAGILTRLPKDIQPLDQETGQEFSEIILELSLINNANLGPHESANIVEFTLHILESYSKYEIKVSVLGAMYCYLEMLENAARLTEDSRGFVTKIIIVEGGFIGESIGQSWETLSSPPKGTFFFPRR